MTAGEVGLYLAALFAAWMGGILWGLAVRFVKELGRSA